MSDQTTPKAEAVAPEAAPPPGPDDKPAAEAAKPDRVAELEAAVADLTDRLLRAAADMENLRRRTEREITDSRQYAVTSFARDVLAVGDNLRRAIDAVPGDGRTAGTPLATLVEGVEMTERELLRALDKHGVTRLEPLGQKFDPNFHQAIFEVESADSPAGTVMQVVQAGYSIADRVLRPALVGVAKAPKLKPVDPAPAAAEAAPAEGKAPKEGKEAKEAKAGAGAKVDRTV